jgi:hypothetical protein
MYWNSVAIYGVIKNQRVLKCEENFSYLDPDYRTPGITNRISEG